MPVFYEYPKIPVPSCKIVGNWILNDLDNLVNAKTSQEFIDVKYEKLTFYANGTYSIEFLAGSKKEMVHEKNRKWWMARGQDDHWVVRTRGMQYCPKESFMCNEPNVHAEKDGFSTVDLMIEGLDSDVEDALFILTFNDADKDFIFRKEKDIKTNSL